MELVSILEDFERLWCVAGFAELFCARLAASPVGHEESDPCGIVLAAHHGLLVDAIRQAQRRGELPRHREPAGLAHAVVGVYLSRRLARAPLQEWAQDAIAAILQDDDHEAHR
jgi:hypothetical protein